MSRWLTMAVIAALVAGGLGNGGKTIAADQVTAVTSHKELLELTRVVISDAVDDCAATLIN